MKIKKRIVFKGINNFERLKNIPPKCYVCGHYVVYLECEKIWVCQGCGQRYDDN